MTPPGPVPLGKVSGPDPPARAWDSSRARPPIEGRRARARSPPPLRQHAQVRRHYAPTRSALPQQATAIRVACLLRLHTAPPESVLSLAEPVTVSSESVVSVSSESVLSESQAVLS